jgi:hypothetical protein
MWCKAAAGDNMPPPASHSSGFSQGRRWLTTLHLLVATGAALALGVMCNYLAGGHFKRFFWADATNFKLSPQTVRVLNSLTNDVTATIFYQSKEDVYTMICALLAEYQHANPSHFHFVALDYVKSPGAAAKLLARLHLGQTQKDFVAFESKSNGRRQICDDSKLSNYNYDDLLRGREIRRTAFRGELYFTSAIVAITHPADLKAYFLTGHGERDPGDPTRQRPAPDGTGYAKLAAILTNEMSCGWTNLALSQTDSIPADCSLLIIPSGRQPTGRLSSNELFQVQTYLRHGNARLLALLNTSEGLEPVLTNWGVVLPDAHVIESDKRFLIGDGAFLVHPFDAGGASVHPIMRALVREGLTIEMVTPRPIVAFKTTSRDPGAPTLTAVAMTSTNGIPWPGERALAVTNGGPLPPPPYTLIAAIEQGVINGHDGTRIVVAGDADFLDDQMIDSAAGANHYFASQTLDWLLQRPEALVGLIGPRPINEHELFMTQLQTTQLRWLFLVAMPGSVLFLGALVWLRRRS